MIVKACVVDALVAMKVSMVMAKSLVELESKKLLPKSFHWDCCF